MVLCREGRRGQLQVDGEEPVSGESPGTNIMANTEGSIYVGTVAPEDTGDMGGTWSGVRHGGHTGRDMGGTWAGHWVGHGMGTQAGDTQWNTGGSVGWTGVGMCDGTWGRAGDGHRTGQDT